MTTRAHPTVSRPTWTVLLDSAAVRRTVKVMQEFTMVVQKVVNIHPPTATGKKCNTKVAVCTVNCTTYWTNIKKNPQTAILIVSSLNRSYMFSALMIVKGVFTLQGITLLALKTPVRIKISCLPLPPPYPPPPCVFPLTLLHPLSFCYESKSPCFIWTQDLRTSS